ncbi:methyl-accepting chemotaxis protein [Parerythrobacter aestuarii]|uniref:methyl-accepting chemotaxis protein n=1 Tax=Parerythrobacter aestuarii TaxID=3020909 RepID=UPI0024DE0E91|nr:methyl-accepting chemotaxis protein [Parerythrobacter aestuarii]
MSALQDVAQQLRAEVGNEEVGVPPATGFRLTQWFRDLPLARKLGAVFGAFLGLIAIMALLLGFGLNELYGRYTVYTGVQQGVAASADLRSTTGEFRYNAVRFIFAREEVALERQRTAYDKAGARVAEIENVVEEYIPTAQPGLTDLKAALEAYEAKFDQLVANIAREGASQRSSDLAFELSALGDALYGEAEGFETSLIDQAGAIGSDSLAYLTRLAVLLMVAGLFATLILVVGVRSLSKDFATKVSEISDGMTKLAQGDRHFEIDGIERKDEIGDMLRSIALFKRGTIKLEQWSKERAERANAELEEKKRAEAEKSRMLGTLAADFEATVGDVVSGVAAASSQLKVTAGTMAGAAEDTTRQTTEVVRSMTEANSGANAAAAASDEFAVSIGEISRQAASSAELAREASSTAERADATISTLSVSANEIGQIVDLIQSIAQRTNLLALNASIEAARGGEAGRGFAVVASEVKELANQTSQATEKVSDKIRAIQESTGASVEALQLISHQVGELETTAISIASAVDQQSVAGQDLARSIDLAARATNSVSTHIEDVRELSLSTGAAASQVLSSSTELEHQAEELREQVNSFLAKVRAS